MKSLGEYDVVVVGGGPAGLGAAMGAGRAGAKVLLLERHGFLGGIGSFCVGMPINQVRPGGKARSVVHELLLAKLAAYGPRAARWGEHQVYCNVEYLKAAAFDALDAAGCAYYVHAQVADAEVTGGRVTGVVVATKNGLARIGSRVVVDCSGDGDVAAFAGCAMLKESGSLSPMTLCFNVGNISIQAALESFNARRDVLTTEARAAFPLVPKSWYLDTFASQAALTCNHGGTRDLGSFDGTSLADLTQAEKLSRKQVIEMVEALRAFGGEAFQEVELSGVGPQVGVRETRRIKGLYELNEEDAKSGARFEDAVAWRSGFLDIGFVRYERMKIHDVPYRALVPEKIDGLLAAGRCISASHVAASAGKSMGNCLATGHAAGLAAALAVRKQIQPRELAVGELQAALRADGVSFDRAGDEQEELKF
jgi:hypothetical protein